MSNKEKWLDWAIELQSIAQIGLTYCKDVFDKERYERVREISAEIMSYQSSIPISEIKDLFCCETGYQTPKIDTRAAIIENDKILLVKEKSGLWSMPGGWCDVNISVKENTIKEAFEEAGINISVDLLVAVQDREKHNQPPYAYGICKFFFLCTNLGGEFVKNSETVDYGYFKIDEIPPLSEDKNTLAQIEMCFKASKSENWICLFD